MRQRVTARLKIMAELDISEQRLPQDGRFTITIATKKRECRISTCPTINGEKIVARLLDSSKLEISMNSLGLTKPQQQLFSKCLKRPQGMILVTGPTGSGKTSTLYCGLQQLNSAQLNISTVEDPVEFTMNGINQVNIKPKIGLNFATVLRSLLRQDPDVIMLGEIRDLETAEIAIKAAQTGHLVLATLHTNSAAATITRLLNIGIAPYNLVSSLTLVIGQRLVRKLSDIAYTGRTGIFELMPITTELKTMIMNGADSHLMQELACSQGMITLKQQAQQLIKSGITTIEETNRVL